jgi:hypothetical protein
MRKLRLAFLLLVLPIPLRLGAAQAPPKVPEEARTDSQVEGHWRITPLVVKGAQAPETNGQFQEFGETYALENALVFWARFGPGNKDWGLFSVREGKVSKVFLQDVPFAAPDGRKVKVNDLIPAVLHAGKRMLYISTESPDHVYGWDGERLVRVLCAGDQLEVSGVRYTIKKATVFNVDPEGRALLYYDANQPQHMNGWVLHDGTSFTPLWKEGDTLPGMPGVQIKNLSAGHFCVTNCVKEPRLLEDGSILAFLEVTGAPYKKALFHIARDKTETMITDEFQGAGSLDEKLLAAAAKIRADWPDLPKKFWAGRMAISMEDVLAARSNSFVVSLSGYMHSKDDRALLWRPLLLFSDQGQVRVFSVEDREFKKMPHHWYDQLDVEFAFDRAMFLGPDSPRVLVTVKVSKRTQGIDFSFPGLYFWDGEKLLPISWETALGMDAATVMKMLESKPEHLWNPTVVKTIGLWRIGGPVSGVGVLLPVGGPTGPRWFVGSASANGQLEQSPQFQVAGRTVKVANVVAWKSPNEALVQLEDGFFLLRNPVEVK